MNEYDKFKNIYDEIDELINEEVDSSSPKFKAWHMKAERFLSQKYGENSIEYKNFKDTKFSLSATYSNIQSSVHIRKCQDGLITTKEVFQDYLKEMQEEFETERSNIKDERKFFTKVFVVYGHDRGLKSETIRLIEKQDITPVVLDEQPKEGNTIIELLEKNTDVGSAICLFTADDLGKEKNAEEEHSRARQNVVFETGFLIGKLGRENIIIVADEGVEMPSDLSGVFYVGEKDWKVSILQELSNMGYTIDANKLLKSRK